MILAPDYYHKYVINNILVVNSHMQEMTMWPKRQSENKVLSSSIGKPIAIANTCPTSSTYTELPISMTE